MSNRSHRRSAARRAPLPASCGCRPSLIVSTVLDAMGAVCVASLVNPALTGCGVESEWFGSYWERESFPVPFLVLVGACGSHRELVEGWLSERPRLGGMLDHEGLAGFLAVYHEDGMCEAFPLAVVHHGCCEGESAAS